MNSNYFSMCLISIVIFYAVPPKAEWTHTILFLMKNLWNTLGKSYILLSRQVVDTLSPILSQRSLASVGAQCGCPVGQKPWQSCWYQQRAVKCPEGCVFKLLLGMLYMLSYLKYFGIFLTFQILTKSFADIWEVLSVFSWKGFQAILWNLSYTSYDIIFK